MAAFLVVGVLCLLAAGIGLAIYFIPRKTVIKHLGLTVDGWMDEWMDGWMIHTGKIVQ